MRVHAVLASLFIVFLGISAHGQRGGGGGGGGRGGGFIAVPGGGGTWWTDQALLGRLGLTDDQKASIERTAAIHRNDLEASRSLLEREEARLTSLLDAETRDRAGITAQISKVAQARSDMERVNALMTLEMRAALTKAQWAEVQIQIPGNAFGIAGQRSGGPALGVGGGRGQQ